jgi:uncharacterized repeat protein (TIGR01451 family)
LHIKKSFFKVLSFMALALFFVGCATDGQQNTSTTNQTQESSESTMGSVTHHEGMTTASAAFPTGSASTSTIMVDKHFPQTVLKGNPYHYTIDVTNLTNLELSNVNIIEQFPANFEVLKTDPAIYDRQGEKVAWALGKIEAHGKRTIRVDGVANSTEAIPCCTEANFKIPALCLKTEVVEPGLALSLNAPSQKMICDQIPLEYTVKNTGGVDLNNVMVASNLPSNTKTLDGAQSLSLNVGSLAAGQEKVVPATVMSDQIGDYTFGGSASGVPAVTGANSLNTDSNNATTRVSAPKLEITAETKSSNQYVGRTIDYNYTVRNVGDANADNTLVVASIPSMTNFKSASDGGSQSGGQVSWNIGTLSPGATKNLSMAVTSAATGVAASDSKASAVCCQDVVASASRPIVGIPALLLELIDYTDPLEIGDSTVYEVRVTNQGTAKATNITLVGEFEGFSHVENSGHTPISLSGKSLGFGGFSLEAKETVTWKITLKGEAVGDHRFHLEMNSDQLSRPVNETESTTIY